MKVVLVIIGLFVFVMFAVAVILNIPGLVSSVRGATSSILLTADGGDTWFALEQQVGVEELEDANILTLAYHPSDSEVVYAGTNGNGIYKSIDSGATWQKVVDQNSILSPGSRVYSVAFGPAFADRVEGLVEVIYLGVHQNGTGQIVRSRDGGFTAEAVYTTATPDAAVYFVAADPANSSVLWAGTSEGLLVRSLDGGETWELIYEFDDAPHTLLRSGNELLVGTTAGKLFLSVNNGGTWQEVLPRLPQGRSTGRIFDITQDPLAGSTLYLAADVGLLRSDTFGRTWYKVEITIPENDLPVRTVAVSPVARNVLFVAAGRNMYISDDSGGHWKVRHLAVRRLVNAIAPHPTNPAFILVGTHK